MEPQIRYCTTDGVRIAYTVTGDGPPVLFCSEPTTSHVQLEWSHPATGRWLRAFSTDNTLVRFDHRGFGLSDRTVAQTLEEWTLDIEAVAGRVGFSEFGLIGMQLATPATIAFAARHPEQVSRLVIIDGFARWSDFLQAPQVQAIQTAARLDFTTATETIGYAAFGATRDESREHGAYIRACAGPVAFTAYDTYGAWDVSGLAGSISAPTLVIRHSGIEYVTMEMAKDLATRIPNAELAVIEGKWVDDLEVLTDRVTSFLNHGSAARRVPGLRPAWDSQHSGTAIILFADIADSTALTERVGDAAFREKARTLDDALRICVRDNGGTVIDAKTLGDGILATFPAASQAIAAALACEGAGRDAGLPLHLGVHAGDVIRESDNIFGGAVNIAARISALATPGEVFVSRTVADLARTSAGVTFEDRGEHVLKGIAEPQRVFAVRQQ